MARSNGLDLGLYEAICLAALVLVLVISFVCVAGCGDPKQPPGEQEAFDLRYDELTYDHPKFSPTLDRWVDYTTSVVCYRVSSGISCVQLDPENLP